MVREHRGIRGFLGPSWVMIITVYFYALLCPSKIGVHGAGPDDARKEATVETSTPHSY